MDLSRELFGDLVWASERGAIQERDGACWPVQGGGLLVNMRWWTVVKVWLGEDREQLAEEKMV
ncbi:UNVERIFIED_CONTAM: hypothetical protein Sradi_5737500 [Sesamum radiatum]|uniref:Uncharacterized protein n=1 Tax=Sesamum radiatum TaxID=300843 RepID=A0AAW2L2A5_SESRA